MYHVLKMSDIGEPSRKLMGNKFIAKRPPKRSKYRNVKTVVNSITFDSKKEAKRWGELKFMEKVGLITELKRQVRYKLQVGTEKIAFYVCDFSYRRDGVLVVEDVKSEFTKKLAAYRYKKKLMLALHAINIREV